MKRYYTKVKDILSKYHYNSSLVMAELDKEIINYSKRSKLDESITK
jgi:sulfur carrier protein ThiS